MMFQRFSFLIDLHLNRRQSLQISLFLLVLHLIDENDSRPNGVARVHDLVLKPASSATLIMHP